MADFTALKTAIQNAIKQNGNEEITGNLLQEVLLAIVTTLGDGSINDLITALGTEATTRGNADTTLQQNIDAEAQARGNADTALGGRIDGVVSSIEAINNAIGNGYVYAGIATPSSSPTTGKVFYLALTAGTYTNFGNIAVTQGINILKYNGSTWSLDSFLGIDDAPTPSSNNLIKSGGAFDFVMTNGSAFDLTAYNNGTTYADLNAALTALNALPADYKKGGMSFKFVQSSDNKYVQFRCKTQSFSTNPNDWYFESDDTLIENPEFIEAKTDNEGRLLESRKIDGTKVEYCDLEVKGKIFNDDIKDKVDKEEGKSLINEDFANGVSCIENPEFVEAKTDNNNKLLEGTRVDGTKVFGGDVEVGGNLSSKTIHSETMFLGGKEISPSATVDVSMIIEDPENRSEIKIDNQEKIISFRKHDGIFVENIGIETPFIKTNSFNLTSEGMSDFQQALKDSGFRPGGAGDYTDSVSMYISEPRLAHLNIISDVNMYTLNKEGNTGAIEGVNYNVPIQVEYCDDKGNYFKKYALLSGQGRSSLAYLKKGLGLDFFNEDPNGSDFDEDNVFTMKFGNWIPQDSFHIKSFYTDWPRCTTPVVYKLADEVLRTRGIMADRPYKKYYVGEYSDAANANTQSDLDKNMETGARCFPDGFPVIVYQNGEFWGVNAWQLKKHRDNYMLNKKKDSNIHLDGDFGDHGYGSVFWNWDGVIDWNHYCSGAYGIETRNPKNLYCVDGKKYNADTHNVEIIDTTTAEAWITSGVITPTGKTIDDELAGYLRTTGKVRKNIEDLTKYVPYIQSLIDGGSSTADIKAAIEDRFDVDSFIDYIVIGNVVGNNDAWDNNGQIVTWGKLGNSGNLNWSVNIYDCDITFGLRFDGINATAANNNKFGLAFPLYEFFWTYYFDEMKERYQELRRKSIFDAEHITQLFRDWMDRVGYDNYKKEYTKWPESPCFRDGSQTYVNNPTTGGFYGSIYRIYLWIKKRIEYMDAADFFDYNN